MPEVTEQMCNERHHSLERLIREEVIPRLDKTNGRVTKLERWQITLMTAVFMIIVMRWPELIALLRVL